MGSSVLRVLIIITTTKSENEPGPDITDPTRHMDLFTIHFIFTVSDQIRFLLHY